jgi:hypothetical protein
MDKIARPSAMQRLVAAHIAADAEYERLAGLNDWGMLDEASLRDATDPIDEALLAICRARPSDPADIDLRKSYLADNLRRSIEGCKDLTQRAIVALIDDGEPA